MALRDGINKHIPIAAWILAIFLTATASAQQKNSKGSIYRCSDFLTSAIRSSTKVETDLVRPNSGSKIVAAYYNDVSDLVGKIAELYRFGRIVDEIQQKAIQSFLKNEISLNGWSIKPFALVGEDPSAQILGRPLLTSHYSFSGEGKNNVTSYLFQKEEHSLVLTLQRDENSNIVGAEALLLAPGNGKGPLQVVLGIERISKSKDELHGYASGCLATQIILTKLSDIMGRPLAANFREVRTVYAQWEGKDRNFLDLGNQISLQNLIFEIQNLYQRQHRLPRNQRAQEMQIRTSGDLHLALEIPKIDQESVEIWIWSDKLPKPEGYRLPLRRSASGIGPLSDSTNNIGLIYSSLIRARDELTLRNSDLGSARR